MQKNRSVPLLRGWFPLRLYFRICNKNQERRIEERESHCHACTPLWKVASLTNSQCFHHPKKRGVSRKQPTVAFWSLWEKIDALGPHIAELPSAAGAALCQPSAENSPFNGTLETSPWPSHEAKPQCKLKTHKQEASYKNTLTMSNAPQSLPW